MEAIYDKLMKFRGEIMEFHIPRWDDLPDIELYMDQVITFIENNIPMFSVHTNERIITSSMINNYVKLKLIPKPVKKRYNKVHLAYLIAISILKHVFTIQEIRDGILFQAELNGKQEAYNLFCQEQEKALRYLGSQINLENQGLISNNHMPDLAITTDNITVKMATLAFASKLIAEKTIRLQSNSIKS